MLTASQREQFERDGYIVLPTLFEGDEIAEMRREADRILALCINASLAVGKPDPRLDMFRQPGDADSLYILKLQPVKDLSSCFEELAADDRLLGPMRQILGCEPILMEEKLNYKQRIECAAYRERFSPSERESVFYL